MINSIRQAQGRQGYVAIVSTIILTVIITAIAVALSGASIFGRLNTTTFTSKKTSRLLSESCLDWGRLKLALDKNYTGNESFAVGSSTCTLLTIEIQGANKILKASSTYQNVSTNLKFTVVSTTLELVSLEEVASF